MNARDEVSAYLWEGAGPADPEVERLEALLRPLGHRAEAAPVARVSRPGVARAWLSMAAMLALAAGIALTAGRAGSAGGWEVSALEGAPVVDGRPVRELGRLRVGEWLSTGAGARAHVQVASLGSVTVEEGSRVRLARARADEKRLELARGTIHAFIVAPPRLFFVDTPAGVAADLGCAYTLTVAEDGASDLAVTAGWVELSARGRVAVVPSGAVCRMDPARGPGTPYFPDSPAAFVEQLAAIDAGRASGLDGLEGAVTARESLPLWHLVQRLDGTGRDTAIAALARVVPPPAGVRVEALDGPGLQVWWGAVQEAW